MTMPGMIKSKTRLLATLAAASVVPVAMASDAHATRKMGDSSHPADYAGDAEARPLAGLESRGLGVHLGCDLVPMMPAMLALRDEFKVLDSVVRLDAVAMVDDFDGGKLSSDVLRHDDAMFVSLPVCVHDLDILVLDVAISDRPRAFRRPMPEALLFGPVSSKSRGRAVAVPSDDSGDAHFLSRRHGELGAFLHGRTVVRDSIGGTYAR